MRTRRHRGAIFALPWAGLLACVARGVELGPASRRSMSSFGRSGAARPSAVPAARAAARRPHSVESLGSKKKRKFRGGVGMDWDDARLYDEWIKAGAPDEFDFNSVEEIDLDSPPETTISLEDEELEGELAAQLLARAGSPLQRQPARSGGARARASEPSEMAPAAAPRGSAGGRGSGGSEEQAFAAAMRELPARQPPGAEERWGGEERAADAPTPVPLAVRSGGPGASLFSAVDMLSYADEEAEAEEDDGRHRYEPGSETSGMDMPGWELVGHAWVRSEPPAPVDPSAPPKHSVKCPPSLRAHMAARQRGEVEEEKLWPETHWRAAWATAVDPKQHRCLRATWANFNVKIAHNFADVPALAGDTYGAGEGGEAPALSIADEALMKAEMAYFASGLPSIADASSLEVLANPNSRNDKRYVFRGELDGRVDDLMLKLRPLSAPNRVALFHSVVAFSNGTHRILGDGMCAAALVIANTSLAVISRSAAYDDMLEKLARSFSLAFTGPNVEAGGSRQIVLPSEQREPGREMAGARLLRERLLRDGKVLDSGILKVSSFINHQVDVNLIEACGEELAVRLERTMPNKILTVEATGLIPAIFVARQLQVPVVFARKQRPLTISDAFTVSYRSQTKGTPAELIVSEEYLSAGDRVLLIDDFLAGGSTAEALFKLIKMANAKVVGVGVLIEKVEGSGRAFLSGYEVPVESLVKVSGLESGRIDVVDEPPFVVPGSRAAADDDPSPRAK